MARVAKFLTAEELQAMSFQTFCTESKRVRNYTRRISRRSLELNRESLHFLTEYHFSPSSIHEEEKRVHARQNHWYEYERVIDAEWKRRTEIMIADRRRMVEDWNARHPDDLISA